jgi:hypothetical protein
VKTADRIATALSPGGRTSDGRQYEYIPGSMSLGPQNYRVIKDQASWDEIENRFRNTRDQAGRSMLDLCRRYWDDPEYRAQINREIAERRKRDGKC